MPAFNPTVLSEELLNERSQVFTEFLDSQRCSTDGMEYKEKIKVMLKRGESRLIVNVNDVRAFNADYTRGLLSSPMDYLAAFDKALKSILDTLPETNEYVSSTGSSDLAKVFFRVGLDGSFGANHVTPRSLTTKYLSTLVCVDGIITSCFLVRPKLVKSVHYVEKKGIFVTREYRDATMSSNYMPSSNTYPTEDADGNKLSTEYGYCLYRDHQKIVIQEMPERAPPGQLPRSIEILLADDLVDRAKPGDRVQVVGVYKGLASMVSSQVPNSFKTVILANNIRIIGKEALQPLLTDLDIANIKKIAKRPDVFQLLGRSLAPSIYGHDYIKKAVLLMLLGGVEKNLENTHIRGDINILMVGDPSTAKSQILRFVLNIAPLAIATTGRGSSGVGLTAAVTADKETGERRLEAGAMVLADRGVVCIDEFDKMSDIDRVAIHEVMEQQTVTIAKAGLHLSLNARCSVIAAANPIWSQYRESATPQENIRLPDSLLSRFDLLFIVLDTMNERHDRHISRHVTTMHRYLAPGVEEGKQTALHAGHEHIILPCFLGAVVQDPNAHYAQMEEDDDRERLETPIFQKLGQLLREDDDAPDDEAESDAEEYLTIAFIKKYIHYAKVRVKPVLTQLAADAIRRMYNDFRSKKKENDLNEEKTLPVTPRTLETLIRLATAHAKARLSATVDEEDTAVAEELLRFSIYKEVKPKKPTTLKKRRTETKPTPKIDSVRLQGLSLQETQAADSTDSRSVDEFGFSETQPIRARPTMASLGRLLASRSEVHDQGQGGDGHDDTAQEQTQTGAGASAASALARASSVALTPALATRVKASLLRLRASSPSETFFSLSAVVAEINAQDDEPDLTLPEIEAVLLHMESQNMLMYRDQFVIFL